MKWFSRIIPSLIFAIFALSQVTPAHAALCPPGAFAGLCNIQLQNGGGVIGAVMVTILIIAIVVSLFFIIFGAFRYITAAGDQGKTQQARSTIIAAIVGMIIALLSFFIVNVVAYFFTGGGLERLNNINLKL